MAIGSVNWVDGRTKRAETQRVSASAAYRRRPARIRRTRLPRDVNLRHRESCWRRTRRSTSISMGKRDFPGSAECAD